MLIYFSQVLKNKIILLYLLYEQSVSIAFFINYGAVFLRHLL